MEYSKKILIKNIEFLCKTKNIRISELEKKCDLSIGYFSRFKQTNQNASPNISALINISEIFKIPLNLILFSDCSESNKDEVAVISFIEKIIKDTYLDKIHWEFISVNNTTDEIIRSGISKLLCKYDDYTYSYNSLFCNTRSIDYGTPIYILNLEEDKYALSIVKDQLNYYNENIEIYEFYYIKNDKIHKIAETDYQHNIIVSDLLKSLAESIEIEQNRIRVDSDVMNAILKYR